MTGARRRLMFALVLALEACSECAKPAPPAAPTPVPEVREAVVEAPAVPVPPDPDTIPVPGDFRPEVTQRITARNYANELARLHKELEAEAPEPPLESETGAAIGPKGAGSSPQP